MKAQIADHLDAGYQLRDRAFPVRTKKQAAAWKAEARQWADRLYELVTQVDPADVVLVKYVGVVDRPVSHELPDRHPLKDDPEQVLDIHNTQIVRVVPEYLKSLATQSPPQRSFKQAIPPAVNRYVKKNGHPKDKGYKVTNLYKDIALELGCSDSTVAKAIHELELLD